MKILRIISHNRLKAVSLLAIIGDIFMALSGAEGLVWQEAADALTPTYALILASGLLALIGHLILGLWGKGAADETQAASSRPAATAVGEATFLMKPLLPWRYPLDSALFIWLLAGLSYTVAGFMGDDKALLFMGATHVCACLTGWLYPKDAKLMGFSGMQMTAMLYLLSTVCTYWAAWTLGSWLIFIAACAYCACNLILYTVNKQHQSSFTQTHEV